MPKKVIVAVHGVGDQTRFATIRQVLTQFCQYHGEAASVPLGSFHREKNESRSLQLMDKRQPYSPDLENLAFAEVYWADIARKVVERRYDLEDAQPWVQTIVGRVRRRNLTENKIDYKDQCMLEEVLGEMLQTVDVLDRLFFVTKKMGLFSFDLKRVLTDFLGDVQIVADFKSEGAEIGGAFAELLDDVYKAHPGAEIYLVAHSEGTVVTLLGLLTALTKGESPWIRNVRGLMTLGSPIDKHLILWPELFDAFQSPSMKLDRPIEWRNYYDHGDPVGFDLDTARERFTAGLWKGVFNFTADNDHGFTRYVFPGKAHVDYWEDEAVFGHFIQTVVYKDEGTKPKPEGKSFEKPPATKRWAQVVSWVAPYLGAAALLACAVLVLYKAVFAYTGKPYPNFWSVFADVSGFTFLLAGVTVAARIPRLTRMKRWHGLGFGVFLLGAAGYYLCFQDRLGENLGLLGGALAVVIGSFLARRLFPEWGMATLLVPGAIAVAYILLKEIVGAKGELLPIFLGGAFFLYAWWLVALLFDLVFVWHRYIRFSREGQYLRYPGSYTESQPLPLHPSAAAT